MYPFSPEMRVPRALLEWLASRWVKLGLIGGSVASTNVASGSDIDRISDKDVYFANVTAINSVRGYLVVGMALRFAFADGDGMERPREVRTSVQDGCRRRA
jgi:hypothetical protein